MNKAIEVFVVQYRSRDFYGQWSDDAGWVNHTVFDCEQDANECVSRQWHILNEWRVQGVPVGGWVGCKACTTSVKADNTQPNTETKGGE